MTEQLEHVLSPDTQQLLDAERDLLVSLRETYDDDQAPDRIRINDLLGGLTELFTIVIVGEFNAGKSSLINALFGERLRKEGPVPVDDRISILRWGEKERRRDSSDWIVEQTYPVELLRTIRLVDTPGTNSIVKRHQEITEDFIPRADLVLFVTSIDRPLSESERAFLAYIGEWRKKIVFVVNKIDAKTQTEVEEVLDYLRTNLKVLFDLKPVLFPVSAKLALAAKLQEGGPPDWHDSRFDALEDYILKTLSSTEKLRLKLRAPLDAALAMLGRQLSMLESRRTILQQDMRKIDEILTRLEAARADLRDNFSRFITRIDNLIHELEARGTEFLDRYIRVNHLMMLRNPARFRQEFEQQVFHDWEGSVDRTIQEAVDWLVRQNMKLWETTVATFDRRGAQDAAPGDVAVAAGRQFVYTRDQIYGRIKSEAERRMQGYDIATESRQVIDDAVRGVVQSLGLGAGALGLGYLTTLITSAALDVTGFTAATMLLVSSFLVLPYKRRKAKAEFRDKIGRLRQQMHDAIERQSTIEIDKAVDTVREAFEPYLQFFRTENDKIDRLSSRLRAIDGDARTLSSRIDQLGS